MVKFGSLFLFVLSLTATGAQQLKAEELLQKTMEYHDPKANWQDFIGSFKVTMEYADKTRRQSNIQLNFPARFFSLEVQQDNATYRFTLAKDSCEISLNGTKNISEENSKKYRLSCERAAMYKDYYSYLFGLPMKLNYPGTQIDPVVALTEFKGKVYLRLKVTYDPEVGKDIWYFYFDPNTFAMEAYQFFHDESKNDGEYILLSGLETINGIKMPKTRAWYYNKDDAYLGTDILNK